MVGGYLCTSTSTSTSRWISLDIEGIGIKEEYGGMNNGACCSHADARRNWGYEVMKIESGIGGLMEPETCCPHVHDRLMESGSRVRADARAIYAAAL